MFERGVGGETEQAGFAGRDWENDRFRVSREKQSRRRKLFQGGNAGLQPGEEKIGDAGEDSGEQAEHRGEAKSDQLEPEFGAEFAGFGVGDVAEGGVAVHSGVNPYDYSADYQEEGDQDSAEGLPRIKWIAGNGDGDG